MELSILIPARNEMFLDRTIQDIVDHAEAETEVIATLDGAWARPAISQHERVNIIYVPEPIGQRAATNMAARLARGKYVMKVDAHCAFDQGFDRKMLEGFKKVGDDVTMVPIMRNLHVFNWKCYYCGWAQYQGPRIKECPSCKKRGKVRMKVMWISKPKPQSWSYCFDSQPHFQYFNHSFINDKAHRYRDRPEVKKQLETGFTESMSLQGSCFMTTRDNYWRLNLCDEELGSWGNQGIEVACKTWLSGGRVLVNHNTFYAHMFRTQGGEFTPDYLYEVKKIAKTKQRTWDFLLNGWDSQIYPVSWLVEKFWPVPGWTEEDLAELKRNEKLPNVEMKHACS